MTNLKSKKIPIWEKTKKEKRKKKWIRLAIIIIILLALGNLFFRIPSIYKELNRPFKNIQSEDHHLPDINKNLRVNILLFSYEKDRLIDLVILSAEPVDKKLTSVSFGLPKLTSLNVLLNRSFRSGGEEKLEKHLETSLGIPIDRYIAIEDKNLNLTYTEISEVVDEIKSISIFWTAVTKKSDLNKVLRTNFSTSELFSTIFSIRGLRYEEENHIQFTRKDVDRLRTDATFQLVQSNFLDRKILDEGASVAIENYTSNQLAGINLANYITNLGAAVVSVDHVDGEVGEDTVIVREEKPLLLERTRHLFDFKPKDVEDEANFSGDILIKIGESEARALTLE